MPKLALAKIVRDPRLQMRNRLDRRTWEKYATVYRTDAKVMPPLHVALVGKRYFLVDGFHRLEALDCLGATRADVTITKSTWKEAQWLAAKANLQHGLPLKATELRKAFKAYVKAGEHLRSASDAPDDDDDFKSYREMARDLGGTRRHTTVHNWMRRDFPQIARAIGRYGNAGNPDATHPAGTYLSPEDEDLATALRMLEDVANLMEAIKEPERRGAVVEQLAYTLERIKTAKPWKPPAAEF